MFKATRAFVATVGAIAILAIGPITTINAQTNTPRTTTIATRCQTITSRIDTRITTFDANKQKHITRYNEIKQKASDVSKKLKDAGYDTTKLDEDLQTLNTKILDFASSYKTFIDTLKEARNLPCGQSEGAFKEKLQQAKGELTVAREDAKEVREFIKNTIKEDLKQLRNQ